MTALLRTWILIPLVLTSSCMRYLTHDRAKVILPGVDVDQTFRVAEHDLAKGGLGSVLALWAVRDQHLTADQAAKASSLYFAYVDSQHSGFNLWHLTWAISNMYRQGGEEVRRALASAHTDATARAARLGGLADKFANGPALWMGDAHSGGRAYARKHVVVPGNARYLQSYDEYLKRKKGR